MWGVFRADAEDSYHVMPADNDGRVLNDHRCTIGCWCQPVADDQEPRLLIHFDAPLSLH